MLLSTSIIRPQNSWIELHNTQACLGGKLNRLIEKNDRNIESMHELFKQGLDLNTNLVLPEECIINTLLVNGEGNLKNKLILELINAQGHDLDLINTEWFIENKISDFLEFITILDNDHIICQSIQSLKTISLFEFFILTNQTEICQYMLTLGYEIKPINPYAWINTNPSTIEFLNSLIAQNYALDEIFGNDEQVQLILKLITDFNNHKMLNFFSANNISFSEQSYEIYSLLQRSIDNFMVNQDRYSLSTIDLLLTLGMSPFEKHPIITVNNGTFETYFAHLYSYPKYLWEDTRFLKVLDIFIKHGVSLEDIFGSDIEEYRNWAEQTQVQEVLNFLDKH